MHLGARTNAVQTPLSQQLFQGLRKLLAPTTLSRGPRPCPEPRINDAIVDAARSALRLHDVLWLATSKVGAKQAPVMLGKGLANAGNFSARLMSSASVRSPARASFLCAVVYRLLSLVALWALVFVVAEGRYLPTRSGDELRGERLRELIRTLFERAELEKAAGLYPYAGDGRSGILSAQD
ncbi:uncharacterized protein [Dermacentor albipictus]|uniref:uncharacterized protein isoform X1 n=2 Tax=Dermacentor albipictus TaxID=60249 RepID=UPI0038FCFF41